MTRLHVLSPTSDLTQVSLEHLSRIESLRALFFERVLPTGQLRFEVLATIPGLKELRVDYSEIGDEFVLAACEIPQLTDLYVVGCPVTDESLQHVVKLKSLDTLSIESPKLTDAAVESFGALRALESLGLKSPRFTDAIWKPIAELPSLMYLTISWREGLPAVKGTGISALSKRKLEALRLDGLGLDDESLREIATVSHLRFLSLNRSPVSDEGLKHLAPLKDLRTLQVKKTNVTEAGVAELKKNLPNCNIYYREDAPGL